MKKYKNLNITFILTMVVVFLSSTGFAQISTYKNPYEDYGKLHNAKLEDFYNRTFGAGDTTEQNVVNAFKGQRFSGLRGDNNIKSVIENNMSASAYIDQVAASANVKTELKSILNKIDSHDNNKTLFVTIQQS